MDFEQSEPGVPPFWQSPVALHLISRSPRCMISNRPPNFHQHLFYELALIEEGACDWSLDDKVVRLHPGEALLLPPGQRHAECVVDQHPCCVTWIGFDANRPTAPWTHRAIPLGDDLEEAAGITRLIAREQSHGGRFMAERVSLLLQTLLVLITRRALGPEFQPVAPSSLNRQQRACMEAAALYFRQNIADSLSIAQVAAYYSLCPTYFSRLFHRHHGITPNAYLHRARLEAAAALLDRSVLSVKEVARRCGFSDSAHFCKAFRKHYLSRPSDYRALREAGSCSSTDGLSPP